MSETDELTRLRAELLAERQARENLAAILRTAHEYGRQWYAAAQRCRAELARLRQSMEVGTR